MKRLLIILMAMLLFAAALPAQNWVQVEWFGHSCFRLTLPDGFRVVFDPMKPGRMRYTLPDSADLALMTHDHFDHNNWQPLRAAENYLADGTKAQFKLMAEGKKDKFVKGIVEVHGGEISFYTVPSFHDDKGGRERGVNGIICLQTQGIRFAHLGDLGTVLDSAQIAAIGQVDVLFIPVGGRYTIDDMKAYAVCRQLRPRIVIPMHFGTDRLSTGMGLKPVDDFIYHFERIRLVSDWKLLLTPANIPEEIQVIHMQFHP